MKPRYESWGRYPQAEAVEVVQPATPADIPLLRDFPHCVLAYGLGRSYGDSCLNNNGILLDTTRLAALRDFDRQRGIIRCEAGFSLADLLTTALPDGWFPPVLPGTKFVTVGGAIANDIHGKNHHRAGTFGCHVPQFELLRSDGRRLPCSREQNPDLYEATIGGLGLTGLILWADIQLKPVRSGWIDAEYIRFDSLDAFFELSEISDLNFEYTVAWIDCMAKGEKLGRGIFTRGNHAAPGLKKSIPSRAGGRLNFPGNAPDFLLNSFTVKIFNQLYYHKERLKKQRAIVPYESFFFPLDAIRNWNRIYGKRGFFQYQCVVPFADGHEAIRQILTRIARSGNASFLGVLKTFGRIASPGMLSFPRPGVTLALDFANLGEKTLRLFDDLDAIVYSVGGALYPCKDARMPHEMFAGSFPRLDRFRPYIDPQFSSSFWRRVMAETDRGCKK
jgi:FAD/FMN-containing dehydrogenase